MQIALYMPFFTHYFASSLWLYKPGDGHEIINNKDWQACIQTAIPSFKLLKD